MAAAVWNRLCLTPPSIVNCCYSRSSEITELGSIKSISDVLLAITSSVKDNDAYCNEVAFFNQLVYKLAALFRNDKKLNLLKQIKKCLMRILAMKLGDYSEKLSQDLIAAFNSNFQLKSVYLPSKQMFEYLLIRIMGFAKLLVQTLQYIQQSCLHILQLLYIGHFRNISCLIVCTLSRLWVILRVWLLRSCRWYSDLKPFVEKLKATSAHWLPDDEQLPCDLQSWLGDGAKYLQPTNTNVEVGNLPILARFSSEQSNSVVTFTPDTTKDVLMSVADVPNEDNPNIYGGVFQEADVGVALDRASFLKGNSDAKKRCEDSINIVLAKDLNSFESIAEWIRRETTLRLTQMTATNHFSKKQFNLFRDSLSSILSKDKKSKDLALLQKLIKKWFDNPVVMRKEHKSPNPIVPKAPKSVAVRLSRKRRKKEKI